MSNESTKIEIKGEAEIRLMVNFFYEKVNGDELLSPVFNDFAGVNWEKHLPIMYNFWSTVLLGDASYKGNPFLKHIPLPVGEDHFVRWVELFRQTVDENFTGTLAEEAKLRATSIAAIFNHKLTQIKAEN
jgi:hemoglobin